MRKDDEFRFVKRDDQGQGVVSITCQAEVIE